MSIIKPGSLAAYQLMKEATCDAKYRCEKALKHNACFQFKDHKICRHFTGDK